MEPNTEKQRDPLANRLIDELGGTTVVARMCDIQPPSVSEWRIKGVPKPWLKFIRCSRPDLFKDEQQRDAA